MKVTATFAVLLCSLFYAMQTQATDWSRFRGSDGSASVSASNLPVEWSDEKNLAWKKELPGYGASTPILSSEKMILTYYSGYGFGEQGEVRDKLKCHTLCIEKTGGKTIWDKSVAAAKVERDYAGFVQQHGYTSGSPVTDGKAVYSFFGTTGVVAYALEDGKQLWGPVLVGEKTHGFGTGASPIVYEDLVIVNASVESGSLVALNKSNGDIVWETPGIDRAWNTPLVVETKTGPELVISIQGKVKAYNPKTGKELWSCEGIPDYICPSVIEHDGIVYAIGGRKSKCLAVKTGGRGDVTDSHRLWIVDVGSNVPSPVYHDGHLYWMDHRGQAFVVNATNGDVLVRKRVNGAGKTYASVTLADGKLYTVTRDRGAFVFEATPEMPQLAHNQFSSDETVFNASPVIDGGNIYLRSDKALYCIAK